MRLQIAKRTELALRVLQVAADGRRHKSSAIAAAIDSTPAFVTHVVRPLVARNWLRSVPGPTGGYELHASLDSISLLALIEACEGPTDDGRCVLEERQCRTEAPCALHEPWLRARGSLLAWLDDVPISSLTESSDHQRTVKEHQQ